MLSCNYSEGRTPTVQQVIPEPGSSKSNNCRFKVLDKSEIFWRGEGAVGLISALIGGKDECIKDIYTFLVYQCISTLWHINRECALMLLMCWFIKKATETFWHFDDHSKPSLCAILKNKISKPRFKRLFGWLTCRPTTQVLVLNIQHIQWGLNNCGPRDS